MKLLVFLAKGFETIEFSGFIDVMGWAKTDFGCDVEVVTGGFNEKVISSFNIPVLADKTIDEVSVDESNLVAEDTDAATAIKDWFSKVQEAPDAAA